MLHPYQILLPLFSLLLVRVDLTDLFPLQMEVKVLNILDGDTLEVQKGSYRFRVRLSRIDAPEKAQRFYDGESAGSYSLKCFEKLLSDKPQVTMLMERFDMYGRILGDVDGLNFKVIANGCANLYPHTQFESRKEKALYLRALYVAKRMKRGVWGRSGYLQPKHWRKTNKQSGRRQWRRLSYSRKLYQPDRKL